LYPNESERVAHKVTDAVIEAVAQGVTGKLGGKVGIAPRIFLKKLVDLCDKVAEYEDFDPQVHSQVVLDGAELTDEERAAAGVARTVDDIALDIDVSVDKGLA
jgi:hypothetical protein